MNKRKALSILVGILSIVGMASLSYPFLMSLNPSARAINNSFATVHLPKLELGVIYSIKVDGVPLLILRPNEYQKQTILKLDSHVWDKSINSYHETTGAYIYWGISPRFGCELAHFAPQDKRSNNREWLGGYWDNWCEVSFDYAGRSIKNPNMTLNGFVWNNEGLPSPSVELKDGNKLVVSLYSTLIMKK
ncbi:hypothetical protein [Candidatus Albibeggiatoa sp. nov. NOAA]|uniref:hypothetical protein n=1 Tax=Candidatus Albibeggiatoa sp. nov. NOAA TaxID=3162724 RepID=UPI0033028CF2|nr:hypothetical protein [Thiotrichaceae bacterium]